MTANQPQGAPAPRTSDELLNQLANGQFLPELIVGYGGYAELEAICKDMAAELIERRAAPLAERRGQEVEKRIEAVCVDYFAGVGNSWNRNHPTSTLLCDSLRRHFAGLGAPPPSDLMANMVGVSASRTVTTTGNLPLPPDDRLVQWERRTGPVERRTRDLRCLTEHADSRAYYWGTKANGEKDVHQHLPNRRTGPRDRRQPQAARPVEVPRRWVIAVNEFIEDWQKGDFNLPQLAALYAQAIIEAGADGPDLEACLNCGTDHSKGECRVVVAPASQDNPAPRCWCGRVLDDSAHLDNSLIHCEGEHGENKAHWFQPERRSGPAERRVTDLGCICAREKGRLHKYHDTTEPVSVRTGARDRRQPLRRAGVDLDQKQAADAHFKAKPAGTSSKPAAQNATGYAATVPEVPTCHKCGAFMVKAKPVYDCPECGATTAITESAAPPPVTAGQTRPIDATDITNVVCDMCGVGYDDTRQRLQVEERIRYFASSLLAQQQTRREGLPDRHAAHVAQWLTSNERAAHEVRHALYPIGMVGRWIDRAEAAEQRLEEATKWAICSYCGEKMPKYSDREEYATALTEHMEHCPTHPFNQWHKAEADAADLRGLLRELVNEVAKIGKMKLPEVRGWLIYFFDGENALRQRIQQATAKTEAGRDTR